MSQGQVDHKLLPQMLDFTGAEVNVVPSQFFHDFSGLPVAQEKGLADKNQHIVTEGAARRHPLAQLLGPIDGRILARGAGEESFVRGKGTQRQGLHRFALRFVPLERVSFTGTRDAAYHYSQAIARIPASQPKRRRLLYAQMLATIASDLVPERPDRREPRCQKRRPKAYPFMTRPRHLMQDAPKRSRSKKSA